MEKATKIAILTVVLLLSCVSVYMVQGGLGAERCQKVEITIANPPDEAFITVEDIQEIVTRRGERPLEGMLFDKINMAEIEDSVRRNKQVKSCEIHAGVDGKLLVDVVPHVPIARVLRDSQPDVYLAEDGTLFPTSEHYTARVLLLSGPYFTNLIALKSEKRKPLVEFIKLVTADEFWKAQFTHMEVSGSGQISIVPLVGDHLIEFGTPEQVDLKLKRLKIFYDRIAGVPQWSAFRSVSVAYANQIVCK